MKDYETVGCDQMVFSVSGNLPFDSLAESIALFGDHVIPEFDRDAKHSTVRYREQAGGPLVPKE